jgi:hypothetical protein
MTESLAELLRRSADAVTEPRVDVAELLAQAGKRQRRRRLAVAGGTAALVGAVAVGSLALRDGSGGDVEPAPSPSPSPPSSVAVDPTGTRPLVYAEGSTVHVGDESFDAHGDVKLLDITDDGVVFVTEDRHQPQLWFHDDTTTVMIGMLDWTTIEDAYAPLRVYTPPSGSLVVWKQDQFGDTNVPNEYVVYDTSLRGEVARIPASGRTRDLQFVADGVLYFRPGQHVLRYDVAAGTTAEITRATMDAELADQTRMFTAVTESGSVIVEARPHFDQVGSRFVAHVRDDAAARDYVDVRRTNGQRVQLRLPGGYHVPAELADNVVSYWLDDDRVTIGAGDSAGDVGPMTGDLLVCRLPNGVCRVAQRDVIMAGSRY